jgi:adenylosuccinate lyase
MAALWADEAKAQTWLAVELAVTQAQEALGRIPQGVTARCRANAHIDLPRALAIEEEVRHDVIAFLTMLAESLGDDDARYVHLGMTSSDLVDTALALQLRDAGQMLLEGVVTLRNTVYQQAVAHISHSFPGRNRPSCQRNAVFVCLG